MLLAAPLLLFGALPAHSTIYNVVWTQQFVAELASGAPYPRWLPESFAGLGSPAFFFYAPLPFFWAWLHAPFGVAPEDAFRLLGLSMATMLLASGLTMRAWLGRHAGPRAATVGAVVYMSMPYHMYDLHQRASLGELAAYTIVPLVALGVSKVARDGARGIAGLGAAAGLLLLSHLPTSLGAVLLFPAQFVAELRGSGASRAVAVRRIACAACAGILAFLLAAAHVLPALGLGQHASLHVMNNAYYDARSWRLVAPFGWPNATVLILVASIAVAILACAAIVAWCAPRGSPARWWAAMAAFIVLAAGGVVPGLWEPWSPFAMLQFPWRLLLLAEFAIVTAVVLAAAGMRFRRVHLPAVWLVAALVAPAFAVVVIGARASIAMRDAPEWSALRHSAVTFRPDALEYLPQGTTTGYNPDGGYRVHDLERTLTAIAARGVAWAEPQAAATVEVTEEAGGALAFRIVAAAEARIVIRRFHFPTWRIEAGAGAPAPSLEPHGPHRLLSFRVGPGEHHLRLVRSPPPVVVMAEAISLAAILLALLLALVGRGSARKPAGPDAGAGQP